jgi:hypothetical protein
MMSTEPEKPSGVTARTTLWVAMAMALATAASLIGWRFDQDIRQARARVAHGSTVIETR